MNRRLFLMPLWSRFGDGEGAGGDGTGSDGGTDGDKGGGTDGGKGEKTFKQADVDKMIQQRLAKQKDREKQLVADLKSAQDTANMSKEEKEALAARIDEYEKSLLSKDEQTARELKKRETEYNNNLKKHQDEAGKWQKMFHQSTVQRSLADAASACDAESSEQIQRMFGSDTYLSEDRDDEGKTLGTFTPKLKFKGLGEDKKSLVDFDLPVVDAIKKIRDDGKHANLFKHGGTPGTGSKGSGKGGSGSDSGMPTIEMFGGDQSKFSQAYFTWRQTHNLDGSKKKDN